MTRRLLLTVRKSNQLCILDGISQNLVRGLREWLSESAVLTGRSVSDKRTMTSERKGFVRKGVMNNFKISTSIGMK